MIHLFETKIREKNLQVFKEYDNSIPDVLVGDPVRLHQIILNLIDNAVKFTSIGNITIGARLIKEDEKNATIEFFVSDTGMGIPEDKLDKIFENFQQASSETSRLYGGTGLGLAIVKNLIEAQGGSIKVKSQIGSGTIFSFTLSFMKTDTLSATEEDMLEFDPELQNIKVLVVEDILLNQLLMKTLLDEFGFHREIAENGKVAVEMLKNNDYDIILMDLHMPVMNGFEATEYIRNEMKSDIPIIALTADVTTVDLAKCKLVGINDYIAKPVDERLLHSKIASVLKKPGFIKSSAALRLNRQEDKKPSCINLDDLIKRTKSNPALVMDIIKAYLDQTPPLVIAMNKSCKDQNWKKLYSVVHKMIPSFTIMGISKDFENMAKEVQEYASTGDHSNTISDHVSQLSSVCTKACTELKAEYDRIQKSGL
jgi:CheY-like chemotaxis protein